MTTIDYARFAAPATDEEVKALSARIDEGRERRLVGAVKCCLIGVRCVDTHIVSVAIRPGAQEPPRNTDLHFERWTEVEPKLRGGVEELKNHGHCIRRYPYNAAREQPFHWSIYGLQKGIVRQTALPRNERFDMLKASDGRRTVYGNLVVVKSGPDGRVLDVLERELFFIERLVYSFFEDANVDVNYPLLENPLVLQSSSTIGNWGGNSGGWSGWGGWGGWN